MQSKKPLGRMNKYVRIPNLPVRSSGIIICDRYCHIYGHEKRFFLSEHMSNSTVVTGYFCQESFAAVRNELSSVFGFYYGPME